MRDEEGKKGGWKVLEDERKAWQGEIVAMVCAYGAQGLTLTLLFGIGNSPRLKNEPTFSILFLPFPRMFQLPF